MSWRAYDILTIQPDFTQPPQKGLGDGGLTMVQFGQAAAWGAWHGDTSLAMGFSYRFDSAAEQRSLRLFTNRAAGRATPFFVPSWEQDFRLASDAVAGNTQLLIEAAGLSDVTENRPDTDGRHIFLTRPDGSTQAVGITGAELVGSNELLSLDLPLAFDFPAATTIIGRLYLVRLADDRVEFRQERPGHGSVPLRMVTTRQTRHVNENPEVDSEEVFDLNAFVDVVATDEDPLLFNFQAPETIGPAVYGVSQPDNFFKQWFGFTSVGGFSITDGSTTIPSDLYDSSFETQHISFAFDPGGRESIAWRTSPGVIRLGWKSGGVNHWMDFPGISPVMFQTWIVNGTVSAGDADLIVFYLREGFSGIFARFYRESYATEHLVCRSPAFPIYLQLARRFEGRIEIIGMDSGHRLCRWRTEGYVTPPELQVATTSVSETIPGIYRAITVTVSAGTVEMLTDGPYLGGQYRSVLVHVDAPFDTAAETSVVPSITGAYTDVRVPVDVPDDSSGTFSIAQAIPGEYKEIAKQGLVEDSATSSINPITGTYAP